jgi:DNA-binding LacI/PurR family transcriptional regulator
MKGDKKHKKSTAVTLQSVARHVGLTPGTVSSILNDAPSAQSIPLHTKERVLAAVKELNYKPNFFARTLRKKRTYTLGVIAEEIGGGYGSGIISGIEQYLSGKEYFFLTVAHRHDLAVQSRYSDLLIERGVEGFITIDTTLQDAPAVPTVAVGGHRPFENVTNVTLDQELAVRLALQHLMELGHKNIAFMQGHPASPDAQDRWDSICSVARELQIAINPNLMVRFEYEDRTPQQGYFYAKKLLERSAPFTALFAYNDISAIGAIRLFRERGLLVPSDISVVGFDDIAGDEFHIPSLTTVRQPLEKMGQIAAQTLITRLEKTAEPQAEIRIPPEFMIRESTCALRNGASHN